MGCAIIFFTSWNLSNVIIFYLIILINKVLSINFLLLEENIICVLLCQSYVQTIKQQVYQISENFDKLSNINFYFVLALLL